MIIVLSHKQRLRLGAYIQLDAFAEIWDDPTASDLEYMAPHMVRGFTLLGESHITHATSSRLVCDSIKKSHIYVHTLVSSCPLEKSLPKDWMRPGVSINHSVPYVRALLRWTICTQLLQNPRCICHNLSNDNNQKF